MSTWGRIRRGLFVAYLVALHLLLIYFVGERIFTRYTTFETLRSWMVADPTEKSNIPTPLPVPEAFADPTPDVTPSPEFSTTPELSIPVTGIRPEALIDTFTASRSEGRTHDALDIPAPVGTPVIAATDGEIVKFFDSERGGITIYQTSTDRKFVLYYAHLQRRAEEIGIGATVRKGTTIGYVGDTGNAGAGNYHLHFSIARITDPKRPWEGEYINPYPILRYGQSLPQ
ncbi:MAG TPA: peptidoglycan DD-metalloendopeptidase family protein [Pyrinomonadaceae bacterium]|nr:peptidoglycan DD-metalloendopeptidase family protein [Pyrinomonadaceae bacterium]